MEKIKEHSNNDTSDKVKKLEQEKEQIHLLMIKEIQHEKDERNKVEESLKEANKQISEIKTELDQCKDKYHELEKYNQIIKGELTQAKLHIEQLHMSSDKIDEQRER